MSTPSCACTGTRFRKTCKEAWKGCHGLSRLHQQHQPKSRSSGRSPRISSKLPESTGNLGQQKLGIESKVAKAKAVLEEQQAQRTKVQQKLAEQQQEVEACSRKYAEKVLQGQLEPEVPELRPGVADAVAWAAQAEANKQELASNGSGVQRQHCIRNHWFKKLSSSAAAHRNVC